MNYFRGSGLTGLCAIKSKLDLAKNIKKIVKSRKTGRVAIINNGEKFSGNKC